MKWFVVFSLLFLANCASQTAAPVSVNPSDRNSSANQNTDFIKAFEEAEKTQREKAGQLEIQNEKFKTVPEEFKNIDFENFSYPTNYPNKTVTLKNGEYEYENKKSLGGGTFSFSNVYFVDLTNDVKKEAFVFLWRVDCGGSCDGGAPLLYIYSANDRNPRLLWQLELGGMAYDCGLDSLTVSEKKIFFKVFGNCVEKNRELKIFENQYGPGKGASIGLTEFIYEFNGKKFVREKMEHDSGGKIFHMNHQPEISIND
ncbi:MAG TPA: hypothetical protein VNB22_03345 [Pyrinomonadaceae bacterium]|nr:hypothetical protein [Pyrinomonadaceae bacterium]